MKREKGFHLNRFTALLFLLVVILSACAEESLTENENMSVVVSAFLYANEPVTNILITSSIPLGSEDTAGTPINDAIVSLIKNDIEYGLIPSGNNDGYYLYQGSDLSVEHGDQFRIEVVYNDVVITGATEVPSEIVNISISDTEIEIPDMSGFTPGMGFEIDTTGITLTWENSDDSYYYVVLETAEADPDTVDNIFGRFGRMRRFVSAPFTGSEYTIFGLTLQYLGLHRAILYKVNQEYTDLYESRNQDSRNLNEPLTNINNGLGVFSAFSSDTLFFTSYQ